MGRGQGGRSPGQRGTRLTVTATFKKSAVWSDGKPITAQDFIATWRTLMNPNWDITSREGWEDIAKIPGMTPETSDQLMAFVSELTDEDSGEESRPSA